MGKELMNTASSDLPASLFLGIDGGGSKCKARLADAAGRWLGEAVAGPANAFQNPVQACDSILESARGALVAAGLPETALGRLVVGAGLAGLNLPGVELAMHAWQHPFGQLHLCTDIHIACLGAHGGAAGAVIVAGTGSVGYRIRAGVGTCYGAHGFPFGDKGSGAWLGLEAMKAALLALDGLGPATRLLGQVEAHLGQTGLGIIEAMAGAAPRDYGALAPVVLACAEQGDAVARAIVADGADYLGEMAAKLLVGGGTELCLLGGLGERLRPWLRPEIAERIVAPQGQPDQGAVHFALDCASGAPTPVP